MKRTQQRVLMAGLLAFSLAACSYMPWRNTSGTTPATQPSVTAPATAAPSSAAPTAGSPGTDSGPNAARATGSTSEKSASSGSEPGGHN